MEVAQAAGSEFKGPKWFGASYILGWWSGAAFHREPGQTTLVCQEGLGNRLFSLSTPQMIALVLEVPQALLGCSKLCLLALVRGVGLGW